jgi:16S rRNA (cytidine1402-2'-O)-methyltransferase
MGKRYFELSGTVYLVPNTIGGDAVQTISPIAFSTARHLDYWVVENAKSARKFLKSIKVEKPLQEIRVELLDKNASAETVTELLAYVEAGQNVGVLSEAGCPGVADPGAAFVRLAHQRGLPVVPLVGPSSILLALMASGLNGQKFMFHGYLPVEQTLLNTKLREIEIESRKCNRTEIFIETPYRNERIAKHLIGALADNTLLCIASSLTTSAQLVRTLPVSAWRKASHVTSNGEPTVFLMLAQGSGRLTGRMRAPPGSNL